MQTCKSMHSNSDNAPPGTIDFWRDRLRSTDYLKWLLKSLQQLIHFCAGKRFLLWPELGTGSIKPERGPRIFAIEYEKSRILR
ncbi:hypothetical protein G655_20450 [Pseudomonas aeruginosa B136-33]|nr:hypothetical protein G655_20450 [Pseudomonas aeruginosa B136-33]